MANKVLLKKSSTAAKVPVVGDLDYGELALNYTDGKLYYKTAGNTIDTHASITATATLTNKTLTSPTINSGALSGTFSGAHTYSGAITLSDTTASSSTTTGALKIGGGLGVAGTIYADQIRLTNNGAGTNVYIGDDVVLGDVNQANTLGIRGLQDAANAYIVFGNANNTSYIGRAGSNPIQVTGQFKVDSGVVTGDNAIALQIAGYANKGGTGYHDFLKVTNSYGSATNANKYFRLNNTGNLEIINSAYTANIFSLTDGGQLTIPSLSLSGTITDSLSSVGSNGQILQSTGTGVKWITSAAGSSGTVTSIVAGTGLTGGTITTTGTIAIDSTVATLTGSQTLTNKTLTTPAVDRIDWAASGTGAPTTTTRSSGTKLTLYPALGASYVDYAIGINSGTLWTSLPANDAGQYFKWYGGTTQVASLSGTGVLTVASINNPTVTGTLTAGGSAGTSGYYLQTTGTGVQWAEVSTVIGYNNSTVSSFPSGDYNGTDSYVGHSGAGTDAFGVSLLTIFTCMDPVGSTQTTDLGVLT